LLKELILLTGLLMISNLTLFGQTAEQPAGHTVEQLLDQTVQQPRMLHHKATSIVHVPPQEAPQDLTTIYSSLGTDPKNLYNNIDTWLVAGPNSGAGLSAFIALPFTPESNSHISEVRAAVLWYGDGAEQVNLSIHADHKGHPGKLLAGPVTVTNLPKAFTCCQLAIANFSPLSVSGGTQYWVVADTPLSGQGSDFLGEWAGAVYPVLPLSGNADQTGWVTFNGNGLPAGDVLGTVP